MQINKSIDLFLMLCKMNEDLNRYNTVSVILTMLSLLRFSRRMKSHYSKRYWFNKRYDACNLALEYFDMFYEPVYRKKWPSIRLALLSDPKYCAVLNNLANSNASAELLFDQGAFDLMEEIRKFHKNNNQNQLSQSFQPPSEQHLSTEDTGVQYAEVDCEKISNIRTDFGMTDFVPSREYLQRGNDQQLISMSEECVISLPDIPIQTDEIAYPAYLRVLLYPPGDISVFKPSPVSSNGCTEYYLMDAASVVPVLALNVEPSDVVLDMCAAPGGKSLLILETLLPELLVLNDVSLSRMNRLRRMLSSYIPSDSSIRERVVLKRKDASSSDWDELEKYDKVNGLKSLRVNGSLVYSTCSLSPVQNDMVIENVFRKLQIDHLNMEIVVVNLDNMVDNLKNSMAFDFFPCKYGQLIIPSLVNNFGPFGCNERIPPAPPHRLWVFNMGTTHVLFYWILSAMYSGVVFTSALKQFTTTDNGILDYLCYTNSAENSLPNLGCMVECTAHVDGMIYYNNYGCYCGFGGSGTPVDEIDNCCKIHDECYDSAVDSGICGKWEQYYIWYYWQCNDGNPTCSSDKNKSKCAQALCNCDRQIAICLGKQPVPKDKKQCSYK
ncbi:5-methylcytosine rRNA methyltransferase NSUN4 [Trichinella nativa]|uniref:5-methylcytosine rRNA methyltransferase NSUN4 n=1 Tax=Trichinella nativa TaxID=6335 RepID=A0A0V1LF64_9BILA|nr:5-methylcytosine rRNA methyltransferase NSUN4 [Trichinella nativa]